MIKVVPVGRRCCLEHYLDEKKVVKFRDGQNNIAVGKGEK